MAYIGQNLTEGTRREYTYVATAGQTTFNAVYTVGAVDVFQNGVLLQPSDYTATDGTTVVLGTGAALDDEITIHCHNTFSVADTVSASQGGTFNQPIEVNGNGATVLTVDRATSDGVVLDVQKNGTSVGGISTVYDALHLNANADFGVKIASVNSGAFQYVAPVNQATSGSIVYDGQVDLGLSISRFKDLYLSGGVYLGGTGSANYLDDVEDGSFTLTVGDATYTSNWGTCYYQKVGKIVLISGRLTNIGNVANYGSMSGSIVFGGLPFSAGIDLNGLVFRFRDPLGGIELMTCSAEKTATSFFMEKAKDGSVVSWSNMQSGTDFMFNTTYRST